MGQGDRLAAVLVRGHLRHDLGGDIAGSGEAVGPLTMRVPVMTVPFCSDILQVHQIAVVHVLGAYQRHGSG